MKRYRNNSHRQNEGPIKRQHLNDSGMTRSLSTKSQVPIPTETAAETVFRIDHIRLEIFSYLSFPSLAHIMRVNKDCFEEAARGLYHTVTCDKYGQVPIKSVSI